MSLQLTHEVYKKIFMEVINSIKEDSLLSKTLTKAQIDFIEQVLL